MRVDRGYSSLARSVVPITQSELQYSLYCLLVAHGVNVASSYLATIHVVD